MKIISYSDLHLEFKSGWKMPENIDADLMILAGDIITFQDYSPLTKFLTGWKKTRTVRYRQPRILHPDAKRQRRRNLQKVACHSPSECNAPA